MSLDKHALNHSAFALFLFGTYTLSSAYGDLYVVMGTSCSSFIRYVIVQYIINFLHAVIITFLFPCFLDAMYLLDHFLHLK